MIAEPKIKVLLNSDRDTYRIYSTDGVARTLRAGIGGLGKMTGVYKTSDYHYRKLTPTECERLQGFPDGFTSGVSDTQRYKMLGNAVTVTVIKSIAEKFKFTWNTMEEEI
jgi:site-specific DNA-cytosine methylase